jgi:hypothetical protein
VISCFHIVPQVRRTSPPESSLNTLRAATWGGLAQLLLAGLTLILGLKQYFAWRAHGMAAQIAGSNETGQAILIVVVALEYFLHPLSLLLLYLAIEGSMRFVGGLITSEIVRAWQSRSSSRHPAHSPAPALGAPLHRMYPTCSTICRKAAFELLRLR